MQQLYTPEPNTWHWLAFPFGLYKGSSPAEVAFINPGYNQWLLDNSKLVTSYKYAKELHRQVTMVADLCTRFLSANSPRDRYEFAILKTKKGSFGKLISVRKDQPIPEEYLEKYKFDKRVNVLDVNLYKNYKRPERGCDRMAKSMRTVLFPHLSAPPSKEDCELCFIRSSNFAK